MVIERSQNLKPKPENPENVAFGHVFTDHMLEIDYDANNGGWGKPRISEFGDLSLVSNLHYFGTILYLPFRIKDRVPTSENLWNHKIL